MCGIVGYIGTKKAYPILVKGLKRLEYHGYDSAGLAMIGTDGELNIYKSKGKVDFLTEYCSDKEVSDCIGFAHTRWATHGEPPARNAHPHYSRNYNLAIIHNGIIENYANIKAQLQAKRVEFKSDTDTEVLMQLVHYIMVKKNLKLLEAVQEALHQVIGAYAIAIIDKRAPRQIIAARKQSPLVVGIGENKFFLGADANSIIDYTDKVVYLKNGNIAVIRLGEELTHIPDKMALASNTNEQIERLAPIFTYARNCLYLGRGYNYSVALEGALKLKDYIHAEGYPSAKMKHGPIALIDSEIPVFVIATRDRLYEKVISNIQEVRARGGRVTVLVTEGDTQIQKFADHVIMFPDTLDCFLSLVASIPLQLLAYHIAVCKGKDVDRQRNLAKSVTVE